MGAHGKIGRQLIIERRGYSPKMLDKAGDMRQILSTYRGGLIGCFLFFHSG